MEKRLVYYFEGSAEARESIVVGAVDELKDVPAQMMDQMKEMTPEEAAKLAMDKVDEVSNAATAKFDEGDSSSKAYIDRINKAAEIAVSKIDENEKNAVFDLKETELRTTMLSNATALGEVNIKDVRSLKLYSVLKDTAVALQARLEEIGVLQAPGRLEQKKQLETDLKKQILDMGSKADELRSYWERRMSEKDALLLQVKNTLDAKKFPNPDDLNVLDSWLIQLERMRDQYGALFEGAGLNGSLNGTIKAMSFVVRSGQKKFSEYFSVYGPDTKVLYDDLALARQNMTRAQDALKAEKDKNSTKAGALRSWLSGATEHYLAAREAVLGHERIISKADPVLVASLLSDRIAVSKKNRPPGRTA